MIGHGELMYKTKLFLSLFIFLSSNAFSQNIIQTSDVKVSAKALSGCFLFSQNISFGTIEAKTITNNNNDVIIDTPITIQCSKNTTVKITAISQNNQAKNFISGFTYNRMLRGNTNDFIAYAIKTNSVTTNSDYQLISRPVNDNLGVDNYKENTYALTLKMLTGQPSNIPLKGILYYFLNYTVRNGEYSDLLSYEVNF